MAIRISRVMTRRTLRAEHVTDGDWVPVFVSAHVRRVMVSRKPGQTLLAGRPAPERSWRSPSANFAESFHACLRPTGRSLLLVACMRAHARDVTFAVRQPIALCSAARAPGPLPMCEPRPHCASRGAGAPAQVHVRGDVAAERTAGRGPALPDLHEELLHMILEELPQTDLMRVRLTLPSQQNRGPAIWSTYPGTRSIAPASRPLLMAGSPVHNCEAALCSQMRRVSRGLRDTVGRMPSGLAVRLRVCLPVPDDAASVPRCACFRLLQRCRCTAREQSMLEEAKHRRVRNACESNFGSRSGMKQTVRLHREQSSDHHLDTSCPLATKHRSCSRSKACLHMQCVCTRARYSHSWTETFDVCNGHSHAARPASITCPVKSLPAAMKTDRADLDANNGDDKAGHLRRPCPS